MFVTRMPIRLSRVLMCSIFRGAPTPKRNVSASPSVGIADERGL